MRRRTRVPAVPERLARFVPCEWPAADAREAFAQWKCERRAWAEAHRFVPASPSGRTSTDSPLGTIVDQLRFERAERARLGAQLSPSG